MHDDDKEAIDSDSICDFHNTCRGDIDKLLLHLISTAAIFTFSSRRERKTRERWNRLKTKEAIMAGAVENNNHIYCSLAPVTYSAVINSYVYFSATFVPGRFLSLNTLLADNKASPLQVANDFTFFT